MKNQESREMYLEVVLNLEQSNNIVRSVDVANKLGYSKPSVNRAMNNLRKDGLIIQEPYGNIILTPKGRKKAQAVHERHLLITDFLIDTLKIDKTTAESDACRIEHVISEDTVKKIKEYLKR